MSDRADVCPFCRENAVVLLYHEDTGLSHVTCRRCGARGPEGVGTKLAIDRWNLRPPPSYGTRVEYYIDNTVPKEPSSDDTRST